MRGTDWGERFSRLVARKTREAVEADLPPYVTDAETPAPDLTRIGDAWSRRLFDGDFFLSPSPGRTRPACGLVFVQSRDGNTGARNPAALGGGDTDKHLVYEGLSRVAADAVLAGAGTIRGSQLIFSTWHPELVRLRSALGKPRHPMQVIATLAGLDLDAQLLFNVPEIPVALLTVGGCARLMRGALDARPWITPIVMDVSDGPGDLAGGFARLRALGVERVSCVGGRHLASQLLEAGLVDDLYLTTAAQPGGEPGTPLSATPIAASVVVRKHGTGREEGVRFEHLRINRAPRT